MSETNGTAFQIVYVTQNSSRTVGAVTATDPISAASAIRRFALDNGIKITSARVVEASHEFDFWDPLRDAGAVAGVKGRTGQILAYVRQGDVVVAEGSFEYRGRPVLKVGFKGRVVLIEPFPASAQIVPNPICRF
jgi:hypothetical protein